MNEINGLMTLGFISVGVQTIIFLLGKLKFTKNIFNKLSLDNYVVIAKEKINNTHILTIRVLHGGSFDDLQKQKGKLEKALECKCEIEDIEMSNKLLVKLTYN